MGMEEGRGSLCYNCFREIPEQEGPVLIVDLI